MKAPRHWSDPPDAPGPAARLLAPLGAVYAGLTAARLARAAPWRAGIPVICVGNLTAGGTGKTPTVIALRERLAGLEPHVVARGHGGRLAGPVQVDPARHGAADVGDEPLLHAAFGPTWIACDRAAGVAAAEAAGARAVMLDDGFQNPSVVKDLSLLVADAQVGFGNGRPIPAGPLRETIAAGLARADALLTLGDDDAQARFDALWGEAVATLPRLRGRLEPLAMGLPWKGLRVLAFAGIGRPEKFFATLRGEGAEVAREVALPDHAALPAALLQRLEREARGLGAQLVTTEKDAARLPASFRSRVLTLPVRLRVEDWHVFGERLAALQRAGGSTPAS